MFMQIQSLNMVATTISRFIFKALDFREKEICIMTITMNLHEDKLNFLNINHRYFPFCYIFVVSKETTMMTANKRRFTKVYNKHR